MRVGNWAPNPDLATASKPPSRRKIEPISTPKNVA
jgi:hypothetical protein